MAAQVAGVKAVKICWETCRKICKGKMCFYKISPCGGEELAEFLFFHYAVGYFMHGESNMNDVVANHERDDYNNDVEGKVVVFIKTTRF